MKDYKQLAGLCILLVVGCAHTDIQSERHILNDTLEISYQDLENSLKEKRSDLLFNNGETAIDCNSYFLLNSSFAVDESVNNQQTKSEYLICDALDILLNSTLVSNETTSRTSFGEELLSKLDLRSFPSSLKRISDQGSYTLKALFPEQTKSSDNIAELNTEDLAFTVEVVALARINNNDTDDWIVWVLDESKSGNYKGYSTLIIYDPETHDEFTAMAYPEN